MSDQQGMTTPEQRAVEHMRQINRPTQAWCGVAMPDEPPTGVADTCTACLAAAARSRFGQSP